MAVLVATSLVERVNLDDADVFDRFPAWAWAEAEPPDIGHQTRAALHSGRLRDVAAAGVPSWFRPLVQTRLRSLGPVGRPPAANGGGGTVRSRESVLP
ncbi:hypothetical protein [Blastococcus sp. SYSU DS0973]